MFRAAVASSDHGASRERPPQAHQRAHQRASAPLAARAAPDECSTPSHRTLSAGIQTSDTRCKRRNTSAGPRVAPLVLSLLHNRLGLLAEQPIAARDVTVAAARTRYVQPPAPRCRQRIERRRLCRHNGSAAAAEADRPQRPQPDPEPSPLRLLLRVSNLDCLLTLHACACVAAAAAAVWLLVDLLRSLAAPSRRRQTALHSCAAVSPRHPRCCQACAVPAVLRCPRRRRRRSPDVDSAAPGPNVSALTKSTPIVAMNDSMNSSSCRSGCRGDAHSGLARVGAGAGRQQRADASRHSPRSAAAGCSCRPRCRR